MELEVAEKKKGIGSTADRFQPTLSLSFDIGKELLCSRHTTKRRKPRYKKFSKRRENVWVELAGLCGLFRTYVIIQKEYSLKY